CQQGYSYPPLTF
nr:immunoglobulin light chain junction region [Macaca mulatta]